MRKVFWFIALEVREPQVDVYAPHELFTYHPHTKIGEVSVGRLLLNAYFGTPMRLLTAVDMQHLPSDMPFNIKLLSDTVITHVLLSYNPNLSWVLSALHESTFWSYVQWCKALVDGICSACSLHKEDTFVPSDGALENCELVIVGQAPGAEEVKQGKPFIGPAGQYLFSRLSEIGVLRESCYITNTVKCRPPRDAEPTTEQVQSCSVFLKVELAQVQGLKVAVGKVATRALTSLKTFRIDDYVGTQIEDVFVLRHPASILRNRSPWLERQFREHVQKLRDFKHGSQQLTFPREKHKVVTRKEDLEEVLDWIKQQPYVALDIETADRRIYSTVLTISIGTDERVYTIDVEGVGGIEKCIDVLKEADGKIICHNAEFDLKILNYHTGLQLKCMWDTMLVQHVLDEESELGLGHLATRFLNAPPYKQLSFSWDEVFVKQQKTSLREALTPEQIDELYFYNAMDTFYTYHLFLLQQQQLTPENGETFFKRVMLPLVHVFTDNVYGIPIDAARMMEVEKELNIPEEEERLYQIVGARFNYRSTRELEQILRTWGVTEEQTGKTERTGAMSLTKDVLKSLTSHPIEKVKELSTQLLKVRELQKLRDTYIRQLSKTLYVNKYTGVVSVSPSFRLHASKTYRINTEEPNIHNIPRDSVIQKLIYAPPKYVILGADFQSAEAFHAARVTGEEKIIEFVLNPELDQHRYTASRIYNIPEDQVTKTQRTNAKLAWFCLQYGGTEYAISRDFGLTLEEAAQLVKGIKQTYPRLFRMMEVFVQKARTERRLVNRFGAIRRFPLWTKEFAQSFARQALNFPFQSEVAIYCHLSAIDLHEVMKVVGHLKWRILFTIHDAIYTIVREELALIAAAVMKKIMELEREGMFLLSDPKVGPTWYDLSDIKDPTFPQLLELGLEQLISELVEQAQKLK